MPDVADAVGPADPVDPVNAVNPVNPVNIVALTRALVDIDSTTGQEAQVGRWLAAYLRRLGFSVTQQPVDGGRLNIIAAPGEHGSGRSAPTVVLSNHLECVPTFFPSRNDGEQLLWLDACDEQ